MDLDAFSLVPSFLASFLASFFALALESVAVDIVFAEVGRLEGVSEYCEDAVRMGRGIDGVVVSILELWLYSDLDFEMVYE